MANITQEKLVKLVAQREAQRLGLVQECIAMIMAGNRVEAVKKYLNGTGTSLSQAQRDLNN